VAQETGNDGKTAGIVMTAIARDRPGVVESLAKVISEHSGNWVDSSMAQLGGEFAGIVMVDVPASHAAKLEKALSALDSKGIDVTVHQAVASTPPTGTHAKLEVTGLDHIGIVLEVTHTLASRGVSIDEFSSSVSRGSMGAEPMFSAQADIILPDDLSVDDIRNALETITADIMVDIELADI